VTRIDALVPGSDFLLSFEFRSEETGWLTHDEMKTWTVLHEVVTGLPIVLGDELRREADLSFLEYYVLAGLSEQPDHSLRMSQLALLANSELSRLHIS